MLEEDLAYILRDKIWEKLIYFSHNLTCLVYLKSSFAGFGRSVAKPDTLLLSAVTPL